MKEPPPRLWPSFGDVLLVRGVEVAGVEDEDVFLEPVVVVLEQQIHAPHQQVLLRAPGEFTVTFVLAVLTHVRKSPRHTTDVRVLLPGRWRCVVKKNAL